MDVNNIHVLQLIAAITIVIVGLYVYRNEGILMKVEDKLRTTCNGNNDTSNTLEKGQKRLYDEIDTLSKKVKELKSELNAEKLESQNQIDILTNKVGELKSENPKCKNQIDTLTNKVDELKSENAKGKNIIDSLTNKLDDLKSELGDKTSKGSSFIRWGRNTCEGTHSMLLYSGYAAGQHYNNKGGPSNMLCLSDNPELSTIYMGKAHSHIYGTEYEEDITLTSDSVNRDVPCAVCVNSKTQLSVMIPGRKSCYDKWKFEYSGIIASDYFGYSASSYICIDGNPEFTVGRRNDDDGRLLYFTSTKCGALPCPPYTNDAALNCVVCSK